MYLRKTWILKDSIEIQKTYSKKYGVHYRRAGHTTATPEAMKKYNEKMAQRELSRLINENFSKDRDYHVTFTYRKEERPQSDDQFKSDYKNLLKKIRKIYKKAGVTLKYAATKAIGKRGAPHHHFILTGIDLRLLAGVWNKGGMHPVLLYSADLSDLGKYFVDQTNEDGGEIVGRRWNCSRNLRRPILKVEEVDAETWHEPPKAPEGFEITEVEYSENPYTGIPFMFYKLRRREIKKQTFTPDGRLLRPDAADRWLRQKEFELLRESYDAKRNKIKRKAKGVKE